MSCSYQLEDAGSLCFFLRGGSFLVVYYCYCLKVSFGDFFLKPYVYMQIQDAHYTSV